MEQTTTAQVPLDVQLPVTPMLSEKQNPKILLIYGPPKVGKTSFAAALENNLILDLEYGTKYLNCMRVYVKGLRVPRETEEMKATRYARGEYYISEVYRAIINAGRPYNFITLDNLSVLEDWCVEEGTWDYMRTDIGKAFNRKEGMPGLDTRTREVINVVPRSEWLSVLTLPQGGGYMYLREALKRTVYNLSQLAPHLILIGHLKDKSIEKKGKEILAKDIDLTGKNRTIITGLSDTIGYMYRSNENTRLSFLSSDELTCGSRVKHLIGKDLIVGKTEGTVTTWNWSEIFID